MTNPEVDPELLSIFSIQQDEINDDNSDEEEYYPISMSGKILQEVEEPYDKAVKIQQANRELFSQPGSRKKPSKVTFDPIPKMIVLNEDGDFSGLIELTGIFTQSSNSESMKREGRRNSFRHRQTPIFLSSRHHSLISSSLTSLPPAPRLTIRPKRTSSQPEES
uniref:Uncharacterized protein n=1 Tax=Graphocephala atropunctata TaxID=36148 RepID=A0A1B6LSU5_9HEMI